MGTRTHYQGTKVRRHVGLGIYKIPVEYGQIEQDIARLEQIEGLLREIDGRNLADDFEAGRENLLTLKRIIWNSKRAADRKRREFLAKSK